MPVGKELRLSPLAHTWIFDLDGTLVFQNRYKEGPDEWLPGALEFLRSIPEQDFVLILTAREPGARDATVRFLAEAGVRYNSILFDMPTGERILLNDIKPTGLVCAHAVNIVRDKGLDALSFEIDPNL